MSAVVHDADGTPLRRTPEGDLVPDVPTPTRDTPCEEHGPVYGEAAPTCRYCHSEALAGDRPRAYIGRHYPAH